jgi:putative membrane protein
MRFLPFIALSVAAGCFLASGAVIGQTAAPQPQGAAQATSTAASDFVQAAAVSDMFEIQSSKLALEKSKNAHIKAFARRMIKDHTASTNKLKSTLKTAKIDAAPPSALDDQHQQMLTQLQGLSEPDFDRTYAQMQLKGHQDAVQLLTDYSEHGDNAALKRFAKSILPTVKDHLMHAEKIDQEVGTS